MPNQGAHPSSGIKFPDFKLTKLIFPWLFFPVFNGLHLPYSRPIHPIFINADSNKSSVKVDHFLCLKNNWFAIHNHLKTSKAYLSLFFFPPIFFFFF